MIVVEPITEPFDECVARALDRTGAAEEALRRGGYVLVKPNLTVAADPAGGAVTPPSTVRSVVEWLRSRGAGKIVVGDGSTIGSNPDELFELTGYRRLCRGLGVDLLDLNRDGQVVIELPGAGLLKRVSVSRTAADAALIVNIPVWKTHIHTVVTLALKNLKGLIVPAEKKRCHLEGLDRAVADLSLLPFPQLVLVDGSTGQEGLGPLTGKVRRSGYLVAGQDPLQADIVCAWMMGFDPGRIKHLRLAAEARGRTTDVESVEINGPRTRVSPAFMPAHETLGQEYPGVTVLDEGACSACLGGVFVALHRMKEAGELEQLARRVGPVALAVGTDEREAAGTLIRVGNCQRECGGGESLVCGCPPQGWLIRDALRALLGLPPLFPLD